MRSQVVFLSHKISRPPSPGTQQRKPPWQCRLFGHKGGIGGYCQNGESFMYGICPRCGLCSPPVPHVNGTWGIELLKGAIAEGTAFYPEAS